MEMGDEEGDGDVEKVEDNEKGKESGGVASVRRTFIIASVVGFTFGMIVLSVTIAMAVKVKQIRSDELQDTLCEKIEIYARNKKLEGTGLNKTPEVIDVNRCRRNFGCTFNILLCSTPCPLGFEMESECAVSCECATHGVAQLDIQFDESTLPTLIEQMDSETHEDFTVFAESSGIQLWNEFIVDGRVKIPFEMGPVLDKDQQATIHEAFAMFRDHTCIDFILRTTEEDYLYLQNGDGDCSASYSRHHGRNKLNAASCYSSSHVLHVLMHALGYHHEHMRDDRDAFVEVVWENVDPAFESAFNKLHPEKYLAPDTNFDKNSIMMLDGYAFSKTKDKKIDPTMYDRDTNETIIGGGSILTEKDLQSIATVYCDGAPENALAAEVQNMARLSYRESFNLVLTWTDWTSWSRCQKTCGNSVMTRTRKCEFFGFATYGCDGRSKEAKSCTKKKPCPPLTGTWGKWGEWGKCSKTCGGGLRMKYRKCSEKGQCKGKGPNSRAQNCNKKICPNVEPYFAQWSNWGSCDKTCGHSYRFKRRECLNPDGTRSMRCMAKKMDENGFEIAIDICANLRCATKLISPGRHFGEAAGSLSPQRLRSANVSLPLTSISRLESHKAFHAKVAIFDTKLCDPLPNFHWFTGDFNGDGRTDTLCGESVDILKLFLTRPDGTLKLKWNGRLNCNIDNIFIGDFNGDGADDIFCKDDLLARNLIYTSSRGGVFYKYLDAGPFCMNVLDKIQVIDINGDGRADLVCKHPDTNEDTDIYISSLSRTAK